jgi:Putative Flp pilus-assembly TadE/G-like
MKSPAIQRSSRTCPSRRHERGVTMVLVALALVAIIAMAALSIDVITLYLAREEAQRTADTAALAAARVISISGLTGDPNNSSLSWQAICGGTGSPATQAAVAVATQSAIGGAAVPTPTVLYSAGGNAPTADCRSLPAAFGVNPMVTVQLQRAGLPTFFSRIWGNTGNSVSATATAEAFNPSNSGNVGNQSPLSIIPVQPRCVKPWIIPNRDPLYPAPNGGTYCDQGSPPGSCTTLVSTTDGSITRPGMSPNGLIGERFWFEPDCLHTGSSCTYRRNPPQGNYWDPSRSTWIKLPPTLQYLPGEAPTTAPIAVPSCAAGSLYEQAVGGCDQSTAYQCGVQSSSASPQNRVDLNENPGAGTDDTMNGVTCLIHEANAAAPQPDGQDTLQVSPYPFQILAGTSNPLLASGLASGSPITSSNSIVSLPIYDSNGGSGAIGGSGTTPVTIIGFLQVFINSVDRWGNVDATVLNVAGCSNGTGGTVGSPVVGSSPVPIRLITPP